MIQKKVTISQDQKSSNIKNWPKGELITITGRTGMWNSLIFKEEHFHGERRENGKKGAMRR